MVANEKKYVVTEQQLAHLGEGAVAYMRQMDVTELQGAFPAVSEMMDIKPGTKLWAVFGANGDPILLADARAAALAGVLQNDLQPVSLH
ncbi:DUF1150 family protein [Nitratireductor sp. CH_MIT9313-5]|uniref:BQ00720 family protein n=1 Tax=Nitratireductor sp. CH_MIT9313-5 TaxID=3107764 RepID=UPI003008D9D6